MKIKTNELINAPKPVQTRSVIHHGFFGKTFVKQHMMFDKRWTPDSLTEEFSKMGALLSKHAQFHILEKIVDNEKLVETSHSLTKQCRDGRSVLNRLREGGSQDVRNILKDHRDMQRLYRNMPIHMVWENIDQRTFILRRERDRLQYRLEKRKAFYKNLLLQRASLENRIKYANEFKLDEEYQIKGLQIKVENTNVRLKAAQTINATYKKIIQILRHDEIFYEPILNSLDKDIEDQSIFIKHILFLGTPAITRFKELSEEYKRLDDNIRNNTRNTIREWSNIRKITSKTPPKMSKPHDETVLIKVRRYVRETKSMLNLKDQFEKIEDIIKKIQIATLCSKEKDIYPRIKSQVNNNLKLGSKIENDMLSHEVLETKMKCSSVLQGVLINNLSDDVIASLDKIKQLKEAIAQEDKFEQETIEYIKNHRPLFVLLRCSLWNLYDIMRHVGRKVLPRISYPVAYLKLPLLKFETLFSAATPPEPFDENLLSLLKIVQYKLKILTSSISSDLNQNTMNDLRIAFCNEMVSGADGDILSNRGSRFAFNVPDSEIDLMEEVKDYQKILNRRQIKALSARLVEEHLRKDE